MKKFILFLAFAGLFLVSAVAQTGKPMRTDTISVNSRQKSSKIQMPSPELGFRFQPKDSLSYEKLPRFRPPKQYPDSLQKQLLAEKRSPLDRMPVIVSPEYYSRMPIYKPDTTIDFKLKIKKIEGGQFPYQPRR
jgi:hypothetical protein